LERILVTSISSKKSKKTKEQEQERERVMEMGENTPQTPWYLSAMEPGTETWAVCNG
jgi:hypothetical protein